MTRARWIAAALWVELAARVALAQPARDAQGPRYEERLVEWGLAQVGRGIEPVPEGKRLEEILIASEEIVAPGDPYPSWLNRVHVKTKPSVIRKEVLLRVGEPYVSALAEETERNLRALPILAVARVIAVKGRSPDGVALLVVTQDLWSLRLNSEFTVVGTLLQYLRLHPTEENFLGLNKQLSLDAQLRLDTLSVGEQYVDTRVLGTFQSLSESFNVIFNRQTTKPEGTTGTLTFGLPLYSLASQWGYSVGGSWLVQRARIYRGASIWELPYPSADAPTDQVPYVYDVRTASLSGSYTLSFGDRFKTNLTFGVGGYARSYAAPSDAPLPDAERLWLSQNYLPRTENAVYLLAGLQSFEASYVRLRDLETFALSEDYQLGHSLVVAARWAQPALFSTSRFVEMGAAARYRWWRWGDLFTLEAAGAVRGVPGAGGTGPDGPWVNKHIAAQLLNLSPILGVGRIVFRALIDLRFDDLNHVQTLLGGDNGLRGLPAGALVGHQLLLFNLEYRTRPVEFQTLHAGLVLFWDAGSAFDSQPALVHTVGIGVRALFPQYDVAPVRIDFGYVLNAPNPPFLDHASGSFGQIEDYRPTFLTTPLP